MMRAATQLTGRLTLGPVLFHWPAERWRDFYFRVADEAPVDVVHVGEVVCAKRWPALVPHLPAVLERLQRAGKETVVSTLALIMTRREMALVRELCADAALSVEANDVSACALLAGRPHAVGPFVNVYNEATLDYLVRRGATRVCLPAELDTEAIAALAGATAAAVEVQAFGRMPLAISARCYHARSRGLAKDSCRYVCAEDPDGMPVETLDGEPFLAVNGVQTLSHAYASLAADTAALTRLGVSHFRLWPHTADMTAVCGIFRMLLDGALEHAAANEGLADLVDGAPLANGFVHGREGVAFVAAPGA